MTKLGAKIAPYMPKLVAVYIVVNLPVWLETDNRLRALADLWIDKRPHLPSGNNANADVWGDCLCGWIARKVAVPRVTIR